MRSSTLPTATLCCCFAFSAQAADPALIAAAKREGTVVWYTTQIVDQFARPASAIFERLYPGMKVRLSRTNATTAAIKILQENRAGKNQSDVFDGTVTVVPLKKEGYVLKWLPDAAKDYPPQYKDPEGYWIATNIYVLTPAFNTRSVPAGQEPRNFQALLDPVIAGEYAVALQIFNHHAVISAKKGAPVKWIPMEPATGLLSVVSIPKNAPHPNAAKLFEDFLVSKEGQRAYQAAEYLPADPAVPALDPTLKPEGGKFRSRFFSPEETAEKMPHWKKVYDEIFR